MISFPSFFVCPKPEIKSYNPVKNKLKSSGFDLSSTVSLTTNYDLVAPSGGSIPTRPKGITFNSDGTKMYIADHQTDKIHQFTLSVGYNLASTVANSSLTASVPEGSASFNINEN